MIQLYNRLHAAREDVATNVKALATVYRESILGLRQGGTTSAQVSYWWHVNYGVLLTYSKIKDTEHSFFFHQDLKRKQALWTAEDLYLKSVDAKHAIEKKLLERHLNLCSERRELIGSCMSEYNKQWKPETLSLPSQPLHTGTPPPASPTCSDSSILHTPSSKISSQSRGGDFSAGKRLEV